MLVYAVVFACAAALALIVYRYDLYEREPWWMLLLALGVGMSLGWAVGYAEDVTLRWVGDAADANAVAAAVASSHEELFKLAGVLLIALIFREHFNDPMDGLIYGCMIGLGMGVEESIFYLRLEGGSFETTGREAVRLTLHMLFGGIGGFALGMARFRVRLWPLALAACLSAALGLHFFWDLMVGMTSQDAILTTRVQRSCVALMLSTIVIFGLLVVWASRRSRVLFPHNAHRRLSGWPLTLLARRAAPPD